MFQSLRPNSPVYIIHKGTEPTFDIGYVTSQPIVRPKYPVPSTGMQTESVVDVTVKIGDAVVAYNDVPAHLDIADCYTKEDSVTIATSKEAINTELNNIMQKSIDIINSIPLNEKIRDWCKETINRLNPQLKEKEEQDKKILNLEEKVTTMNEQIQLLIQSNQSLIEHLKHQ